MDTQDQKAISNDTSLLLAQYHALRAEVLQRQEMENQLATFTVIVFGTILGIGFQNKAAIPLILLYPSLALFLAVNWAHSEYRVRQIGIFIRDRIEAIVGANNIGWEHYMAAVNRRALYPLATRGIFIMTELLAIVVGISVAPLNSTFLVLLFGQPMTSSSATVPSSTVNVLLGIAFFSFILTVFLLRHVPIKPIHVSTKLMSLRTYRD